MSNVRLIEAVLEVRKHSKGTTTMADWFDSEPPTLRIIARIRDKCDNDGIVKDMIKERSGRTRTVRTPARSSGVLQLFTRSPQKSINQCTRESGVSRSRVRRILKAAK